jgi:hypothetical protein
MHAVIDSLFYKIFESKCFAVFYDDLSQSLPIHHLQENMIKYIILYIKKNILYIIYIKKNPTLNSQLKVYSSGV